MSGQASGQASPYSESTRPATMRAIAAHPAQIVLVLDHGGRRIPTLVEVHAGDELEVTMPDPTDPARLELVGLHPGPR